IKNGESKISKKELRSKFTKKDAPIVMEKKWVLETPFEVRDQAIIELINAYSSNFTKGPNHRFDMKFKSKKNDKNSIAILMKGWRGAGVIFPTFFGKTPLKSS